MIATFIKMFPNVARFLNFNLIDEINLEFACNHFIFKALNPNEDLFDGDYNYKNFAIILKGKLSVKYGKNPVDFNGIPKKNFTDFSYDMLKPKGYLGFGRNREATSEKIYQKGDYFCRIINGSTIYSAVALEETNVIYLDYKIYEKIFEKCIYKSEKLRKTFILRTINTLENLGPTSFDAFFSILEVQVKNNILIYEIKKVFSLIKLYIKKTFLLYLMLLY